MKRSDKLRAAMEAAWTPDEDDVLRHAVFEHGGKKWKVIATEFRPPRTPSDCQHRWNYLQNHGSSEKQPWSAAEDDRMVNLIRKYGAGKWAVIASYLPGRNGKQCRERWHNQLNPTINKLPWSAEENEIILHMQATYGNRWAKIAECLRGRTDNAIKNHWHSSMKASLSLAPQLKKAHKIAAGQHHARKVQLSRAQRAVVAAPKAVVTPPPPPPPPVVHCSRISISRTNVPLATPTKGGLRKTIPPTPPKPPVPPEPLGSLSPIVVSQFDWSTTTHKPLDKWLDDLPDDDALNSLELPDHAFFGAPDYVFAHSIDMDSPDMTDVMDLILADEMM